MINYAQALERLRAHVRPMPGEVCSLAMACGRVLGEDVTSPMDLPSFDHAAMDGYALQADHPLAAGSEHEVGGSQAAGDAVSGAKNAAWEIMTGAPMPQGLDTVVPVECTQLLEQGEDGMPKRIRLREDVAHGANVRLAGSDVASGTRVLRAGTRLHPTHVMLLAALGIDHVPLVRKPRVAIVCTGKELQPALHEPLAAGQIYNSNGPYLSAAIAAMGAEVLSCDTMDDTADTYAEAVHRACAAGAELVISTGAVSMGRYDFVPDALRRAGAEVLFHKVAMRPGKPLLAARLGNGALALALPGTPMAVAVGYRFFVVPVLRMMLGMGDESVRHAWLDTPQQPKAGLRHFLRATLGHDAQGRPCARVAGPQQPFRIRPFAEADAWVILPEDAGDCPAGMQVAIASMDPGAESDAGWTTSHGATT